MPVFNGETGELMKDLPAPWSLRLKRKKLISLLSKDVDIQVGDLNAATVHPIINAHVVGQTP